MIGAQYSHPHLMYVLRINSTASRGRPVAANLLLMAEALSGRVCLGAADACLEKRLDGRWKKALQSGWLSEAITLGWEWLLIKNSFSLEETLVRSWPALSAFCCVCGAGGGLSGRSDGVTEEPHWSQEPRIHTRWGQERGEGINESFRHLSAQLSPGQLSFPFCILNKQFKRGNPYIFLLTKVSLLFLLPREPETSNTSI